MANMPDDVYQWIASCMRPVQQEWKPIVSTSIGPDIDAFLLTEGLYDMKMDFPFAPPDQEKIDEKYILKAEDSASDAANKYMPNMRFGMCLLRLKNRTVGDKKTIHVLLDAGIGAWDAATQKCSGHPVPEKPPHGLPDLLQQLDLQMSDIDYVIYSHCHGDHVGWTPQLEHAVHCLHQKEYDYATFAGCPWRQDAVERFAPIEKAGRLKLVSGESTLLDAQVAPEISIVLRNGHTPGHACVEIASALTQDKAVYIGDAMHFPVQVEQPDLIPLFDCCAWKSRPYLPMGGDMVEQTWTTLMRSDVKGWNANTSAVARTKLLTRLVDTQGTLLSPHFPPPGFGVVSKDESKDDSFVYEAGKED